MKKSMLTYKSFFCLLLLESLLLVMPPTQLGAKPTECQILRADWSQLKKGTQGVKSDLPKTIKIELPPRCIHEYKKLQRQIASLVPDEEKRPTVYLKLRGNLENRQTFSVGLLGGTGPIADSHFIEKVVHQIPKNLWPYLAINLLSSPPPRKPLGLKLPHVLRYVKKVYTFANTPHHFMWLTSNTAHSNLHLIKNRAFTHKPERWLDMRSKVVKSISVSDSTSPNRKKVLILGTQSAREKNLYSDELAKIGVSFELLSDPEQGAITKLITEIKTGTQHLSHSGQKLSEISERCYLERKSHMFYWDAPSYASPSILNYAKYRN